MPDSTTAADVLVVDDDLDISGVVVRFLQCKRIAAHSVASGEDALAWLRDHRPLVVLLDISMPDISGTDLLQRIRGDAALAKLPVVLHSALDRYEIIQIAETLGADGVLLKGRYMLTDVLTVLSQFGVPAP